MKYFMIALLITSSLNAMRFDDQKAEETAQVITTTLGLQPASHKDQKEGEQGQKGDNKKVAPPPLKSKL